MTTERLYYSDSYLTEFKGIVIEVADDGRRVYLERTAFYPASGGQPCDFGTLDGVEVVEVLAEEDGRIAHRLAAPLTSAAIPAQIQWARRYEHMQQHTGQHLLSAVLMDLFGFQTLSFHMGEQVSTIELNTKEISERQIEAAETRSNELAREARPVRITFEYAPQATGLRKPSQRAGLLRIIEIEGVDKSACGGTHVRSLAETLPVQIRRMEKVRGNVRLEFVCGERAIKCARQDFKWLQEISRQTATAMEKLPEQVAVLKARLSDAEKERQSLAQEVAQREGGEAYQATAPSPDGVRRVRWQIECIDDTARTKALAFSALGKAVVLLFGEQPPGVLIACSSDAGVDATAILKQTQAAFGGKGGGSPALARGSIVDEAIKEALAQKLGMS